MTEINKWMVKPGNPLLSGVNKMPDGYSFTVETSLGRDVSLILYQKGSNIPLCEIPFPDEYRKGVVFSMHLEGLEIENLEYNFSLNGKIIQDPFAAGIVGRKVFGADFSENPHDIRCVFRNEKNYDWENDKHPKIPFHEMILYKIHVRGYTMQADIPLNKRGTFAGLVEMIPYWQELGVNAVEMMPMYEFAEAVPAEHKLELVSNRNQMKKVNFWGYVPGLYFAPKAAYCLSEDIESEVKDFIKALHKANIECIMEVFVPEDANYSMITKMLRFWNMHYHVDGFHLTGKNIQTSWIKKDPVLADVKLIFNEMEVSDEYCSSPLNRRIGCYNESFLYDMRRFLKSDEGVLSSVKHHATCNFDQCAVINAIVTQDGMTLKDLVTYTWKHNEDNGELNRDGREKDFSWNCGYEGECQNQEIEFLRNRQVKNAVLMMMLSQGVPMIYGGDEFLNTQNGNNNAYCQDNPIGWIDWSGMKVRPEFLQFVKEAIAFRKKHAILHMSEPFIGIDYLRKGFPDISFHGEKSWHFKTEQNQHYMGVMYCGPYEQKNDGTEGDYLYVGYNFYWERSYVLLPKLPAGKKWRIIADTYRSDVGPFFVEDEKVCGKVMEIAPRSIVVLIGK